MWTTGSWPTPTDWSIYWNENLGLISLKVPQDRQSYYWEWITIADKNLWATEIYHPGDTMSEAKCGKTYQRWNNYWFPWIWSSETISKTYTKVNAANYWPYYEGNTFIYYDWYVGWEWCSPHNDNLWWWVTNTFKSMQGPAPDWFHVPDDNEMSWLKTTMVWLWLGDWASIKQYLKMPYGWFRDWYSSTAEIQSRGEYWLYWTSTPKTGSFTAYYLNFADYGIWTGGSITRAYGQLIRCFRNEALIPDNTWRTLFAWTWSAGIFWNPELEVISLSFDGTDWITIADKNIWATYVYENWDTLTEWNCGWYFQRWNNYMFSFDGQLTTSSTQVDATNYGPYYYWSNFIRLGSSDTWWNWDTSWNNHLRWSKYDSHWQTITPLKDMRWPCPEWFHVPHRHDYWWLDACQWNLSTKDFFEYLNIWMFWYRHSYTWELINVGSRCLYWCSSTWWPNIPSWRECEPSICCNAQANSWTWSRNYQWVETTIWWYIRPFKNEPVEPDSTWTRLF